MSDLVILHISDLHFGIENDETDKTKHIRFRQREMLEDLIATLKDLVNDSPEWKPDVVAISGDIAWTGKTEEYQLYHKEFVSPIATEFGINPKHFITCPGNHDIIRDKVKGLNRHPFDHKDSDVLELDKSQVVEQASHFEGYVEELCEGNPEGLCKIFNFEDWPWVSFLSLNSAWDCRNDGDEGRLRVGLPLFEKLIEQVPNENYVITLFHHPHTEIEDYIEEIDSLTHHKVLKTKRRKWLHISECEPQGDGVRCFSSYVEQKSTFILNGHIHKETEPQKLRKSIQLISGTLYSKDTPKYHCRLLKLSNKADPCYRDLRHTIGDDSDRWEVTVPKNFQFDHVAILVSRKQAQEEKERQFGNRLMQADEQFKNDKNLEEYQKSVVAVAKELLHEAMVPVNDFSKEHIIVLEKNQENNKTDILTLKNGGEQ